MGQGAWFAELQALPYRAQVKWAIGQGRAAAAGDAEARARLDGLWGGDAWGRQLAVFACFTSGDGARALAATQDVSGRVRRLGYRAAAYACGDAQALEALKRGREVRGDTALALRMHGEGRLGVIDAYLGWLAAQPSVSDFAALLPLGSDAARAAHWARALAQPSATFWKRLATCAPAQMAEHLRARALAAADELDPVDRRLVETYQAALAARAPRATLGLVEAMLARGVEPQAPTWRLLARALPREVVPLLRARPRLRASGLLQDAPLGDDTAWLLEVVRLSPPLLGSAEALRARLSPHQRRAVAQAWAAVSGDAPLWGLPLLQDIEDPALRAQAAAAWGAAAQSKDGVISLHALRWLPPDLRAAQARRHLRDVVALQPKPLERIPYARYLPWEEALEALRASLGHPEAGERGLALQALLAIPGDAPERADLPALALALVTQRKFEQDPVRALMLEALAQWPKQVWRPDLLPSAAQALRDALDASDLSHRTAGYAEALVVRLFGIDPNWSAAWLATFIKERGQLYRYRIGEQLSDEEVRAAAPQLLAVARAWMRRERNDPLIQLAASLGARLPLVDGLTDLLTECALASPWWWDIASITQTLLRHARPAADALVAALLTRRKTPDVVIQLGEVLEAPLQPAMCDALASVASSDGRIEDALRALALLRNKAIQAFDALLPALLKRDRSLICVVFVHQHIHRRRQDLLRYCLDEAPVRGRFATSKTAWVLPFEDGFWRWTPAQNARYEAALLSILGDPDRDTPTALRMIGRLAALFTTRAEGLRAIADHHPLAAAQEKAVRVLARLDEGQGLPILITCLGDARARFAIYGLRRALLSMPAGRALAVLAKAPLHKVTIAKEVVRLTGEVRADAAYDALLAFDARPDLHRDVRVALLRALWDHLDRAPTWDIYARAVSGPDMILAARVGDVPADRLTAASDARLSALLARVLARPEPEARLDLLGRAYALSVRDPDRVFWRACVQRLRSPFDDEVRAAMMATLWRSFAPDLPALEAALRALRSDRRALSVALNTLLSQDVRARALWAGVAAAGERALADDPLLTSLTVRCAAAHRDPTSYAAALNALCAARGGALSHDATADALASFAAIPPKGLQPLIDGLIDSPHPSARRLALGALLLNAAPGRGWTPSRLALLARLQRDPAPEVAGPAQLVFPPRELL